MKSVISKDKKVLIGGMNSAFRSIIQTTLTQMGFSHVSIASEMSIVASRLESETYDWIIIGLESKESVNAINLLEEIREHESLQATKVSILSTEADLIYLYRAFELGIISYHPLGITGEELVGELTALINIVEDDEHDYRLVAAHYLCKYLTRLDLRKDLLAFVDKLVAYYPLNTSALLLQANAYIHCDQPSRALSAVNQANLLNPLIKLKTEPLIDKTIVFENGKIKVPDFRPFPLIRKAYIGFRAGNDRELLQRLLSEFYLDSETIDFTKPLPELTEKNAVIILEWHMLDATIFQVLETILDSAYRVLPVIVRVSDDLALEADSFCMMGISAVIEGKISVESLAKSLTFVANTKPLDGRALSSLYLSLARKDLRATQIIKSDHFLKAVILDVQKIAIETEIALVTEEFLRVRERLLKGLKLSHAPQVFAIQMAWALYYNHEYAGALCCIQNAEVKYLDYWQRVILASRKDASKNTPLTVLETFLLKRAIDLHLAFAFVAMKGDLWNKGLAESVRVLALLEHPSLMHLFEPTALNIAQLWCEGQYLHEARSCYYKLLENAEPKEGKSKITNLIAAIDLLFKTDKPFKVAPAKTVSSSTNWSQLMDAARQLDVKDFACREFYISNEHKADVAALSHKKVKIRIGSVWPNPTKTAG